MTVGELIEHLKGTDPNSLIQIHQWPTMAWIKEPGMTVYRRTDDGRTSHGYQLLAVKGDWIFYFADDFHWQPLVRLTLANRPAKPYWEKVEP